jgi:hypothetical protein
VPLRLKVLLAILVLVSLGAAASQIRTWRLERELLKIAEDIVTEFNAEDLGTMHAETPAAQTVCNVYAAPEHVFFGAVTGKIVFLITPACNVQHGTEQDRLVCVICSGGATYELDYIYLRGDDGWVFQDSYMSHAGREHR